MTNEKAVASRLLQVEAVKLNLHHPYTWASGWRSPIYCDNRRVLSFPYERDFIKSELTSVIFEKFPQADALAGVATAGISWGVMAADQLKLPFVYVRPKPKEHGMSNQIEGVISKGQNILVIEDLVSTGKSSLQVCEVLKQSGANVIGMVCIFNYGFPEAMEAFDKSGIPLIALTNYNILIEIAVQHKIVGPDELDVLLRWRENPSVW